MKPIPISAGEKIAKEFDYDQVVIVARKVGEDGGEHVTTYGINKEHCDIAARMGDVLKHEVMKWPLTPAAEREQMLAHLCRAEKLAYKIFCDTEVGRERIRAHRVYVNIQDATRVPL